MMEISIHEIEKWLTIESETQNLEFKEAKNQMSEEDICRLCVALANEGGGNLVLGITDKPPRKIVGTKTVENPIKTEERLYQILGFRIDIKAIDHEDGRIVIFHVPSRARGSVYNYKGQYLMRCGSQLLPMGDDRLREIFAENREDWGDEQCLINLSSQDIVELLDTQAFFELFRRPYPTDRNGVLASLLQNRLIEQNNDSYSISRLCALLFARQLSNFQSVQRKAPRVIVYTEKSKLESKLDQLGNKGYAVGFQGLVSFIMSQLPQNEIIKDAIRQEVTIVPEIVIRELVANALIHQDLDLAGTSVMIEIYPDRLEISNPGNPIVPADRFIDGYQSRNERLADLMRRMGICEEKGSGIDKVIQTVEVYQLPAPEFISSYNRTVVKIFGHKPFEDMTRDDRIRACYQHACLKYVMNEQMTNQTLRKRFELPESKSATASQVLAQALEAGRIKTDDTIGGSRKFARYLPIWA